MSKSNFGCTIRFNHEKDVFAFYKKNKGYISSMTISPSVPLEVSFKFKTGSIPYIKEKYKDKLIVTNGNTYTLKDTLKGGD